MNKYAILVHDEFILTKTVGTDIQSFPVLQCTGTHTFANFPTCCGFFNSCLNSSAQLLDVFKEPPRSIFNSLVSQHYKKQIRKKCIWTVKEALVFIFNEIGGKLPSTQEHILLELYMLIFLRLLMDKMCKQHMTSWDQNEVKSQKQATLRLCLPDGKSTMPGSFPPIYMQELLRIFVVLLIGSAETGLPV